MSKSRNIALIDDQCIIFNHQSILTLYSHSQQFKPLSESIYTPLVHSQICPDCITPVSLFPLQKLAYIFTVIDMSKQALYNPTTIQHISVSILVNITRG